MRVARILAVLVCALLSGPVASEARGGGGSNLLIRVPREPRAVDAWVGRVADGGVIEMAAGTYPSPPSGFSINNARRGFTIRAAAGARVALDGGGTRHLLRSTNSDRARRTTGIFHQL